MGKLNGKLKMGNYLYYLLILCLLCGIQFFQDQRQHPRNGKSWWRCKKWYITPKECFKTKFYAAHKFDEDLFRRILHNILHFFLNTRPIELNFQQCHWEQNGAVIMAPNCANTTPSYANASLHPISKNNESTKFYHEAPHGMVLSEIFEKCPPIE